jgi:hypothetical protein|tara:strand:+ start:1381 stop:1905 length:525 start_codon:yes stop_codon:yes gene_type:complete
MPYMLDGRRLRVGRPFNTATASYSQLWATALSEDEKTAIGITYEADPAPFDSKYYFSAGNPRYLDDGTDKDGNKYTGIRPGIVQQQKTIAGQMLSNTDWYVVRKSETDVAIPNDVATYRAAVRTVCNTRETEITAVSTTAELEALMKAPDKVLDTDGETYIDNPAAHLTPWPKL